MKIIVLLLFSAFYTAYGQSNCLKKDLLGSWRQVESISGIQSNIDSLIGLATDSSKIIGTLTLNSDGTYTYVFLDSSPKKNKQYFFDASNCEIILGTNKKASKNANLEIIYLDNRYLIFNEDNNPKGQITHILSKN
ncbi:MAG: hypothetical protein A2033_00005 [Bacteroidetes bacterium GWA2_31_9]|nr:MAG: hypothetical protein A2033_00005 [Bacteroidetes bacterium GWA2_31_9]